MKVENRGAVQGLGAARKAQRNASGFVLPDGDGASEATAALPPPAAAGLSPLLALQEVASDRPGRRKAVARANALLDGLEALRLELMLGRVPRGRLEQIMVLLRGRREAVADPQLAALLDEVELRAAVELAKLGF